MNIEQLLQEKKKKLEELKKQRLLKQDELTSHLSSLPHSPNKPSDNTNQEQTVEKVKNTLVDTTNDIDYHKNITVKNISPPPPILYTKNTTTSELDTDSITSIDIEQLTKKIHRDLEKKIRKELEDKYTKLYTDTVKDLKKDSNFTKDHHHNSEPTQQYTDSKNNELLEYPTTKVKQISISPLVPNRFLTLHDDLICVWNKTDNDLTLTDRIPIFTKINVAIFDSKVPDKIITGSESGYTTVIDLSKNTQITSQIQLTSIISLYESSGSLLVLTSDATYVVLAMNLIDILNEPTNIFQS